ncbi:hypothetical protein B0H14DRAFT_3704499 [Mycena olivaceomarginata]|nr:hypothetical protein B0H14DRAFT_3704499 [Mycena olivaceomarginata]
MTHSSPASFLVLAIGTCVLFSFLIFHSWSFDRFKCLRWNNGANSGTFKRVMTYSYLLSAPLIATYALGFAVIKYRQGFIEYEGGVIPKPYILWPDAERRAIFPLMLTFSVGWSLGIISHLEGEYSLLGNSLTDAITKALFLAFLCIALVYILLLTIWTRFDPLKCEAYTFLGGSVGSLFLTILFIPILWVFPSFLTALKKEGVKTEIIVRLTKFHELNIIRTIFRFILWSPSMLWTDFLIMAGSFGCCISSGLTLVIFFPRHIEGDIAAKDAAQRRRQHQACDQTTSSGGLREAGARDSHYVKNNVPVNRLPSASMQPYSFLPSHNGHTGSSIMSSPESIHKEWTYPGYQAPIREIPIVQQTQSLAETSEVRSITSLVHHDLYLSRIPSKVNPLVHNFTSPIDVQDEERSGFVPFNY